MQIEIAGRVYSAVHEPRCTVCTHDQRMEIEKALVENYAYMTIARRFFGDDERQIRNSAQYLRKHYSHGHMPLEQGALREIAERRMAQAGVHYSETSERYVDSVIFAQSVLNRAHTRVALNEVEPEITDGMAAAKFLSDAERRDAGTSDVTDYEAAMEVYFRAAREHMGTEQWNAFLDTLRADETLKTIAERTDRES
jgi:hypothetical protein